MPLWSPPPAPLAAVPVQTSAQIPVPRPFVARRLVPPTDPRTAAPFAGTPVETPEGLVWAGRTGTWTPKGMVAFTIPGGQGVWANLARRWWSYGVGSGAGLLDVLTGATREYPRHGGPVDDAGIDDEGVPVGVRDVEIADAPYGRPYRGATPLRLPPGYVDTSRMHFGGVVAASNGPGIAGTLTLGAGDRPEIRPFFWKDAAAEPRALPMPAGYTRCSVSALNSRGDVVGLVTDPTLPYRAVIWRADGTTELLPVGAWPGARSDATPGEPPVYSADEPHFVTEDGLVVGRESSRLAIYGYVTTVWDGRRTLWLPQAIEGVQAEKVDALRLAADGRGLLARIRHDGGWDWYRLSPR